MNTTALGTGLSPQDYRSSSSVLYPKLLSYSVSLES